jgi:hypothetical protein
MRCQGIYNSSRGGAKVSPDKAAPDWPGCRERKRHL